MARKCKTKVAGSIEMFRTATQPLGWIVFKTGLLARLLALGLTVKPAFPFCLGKSLSRHELHVDGYSVTPA